MGKGVRGGKEAKRFCSHFFGHGLSFICIIVPGIIHTPLSEQSFGAEKAQVLILLKSFFYGLATRNTRLKAALVVVFGFFFRFRFGLCSTVYSCFRGFQGKGVKGAEKAGFLFPSSMFSVFKYVYGRGGGNECLANE
jgi:hypothetical protein